MGACDDACWRAVDSQISCNVLEAHGRIVVVVDVGVDGCGEEEDNDRPR